MRGTVIYGPGKVWDWKDSRSMQKADGRFVCANCLHRDVFKAYHSWRWGICPPLTNPSDERDFKLEPTP